MNVSVTPAADRSRAAAPETKFQAQINTPVVPPAVEPVVKKIDLTTEDQSVAAPVAKDFAANTTTPLEAVGSASDCLA